MTNAAESKRSRPVALVTGASSGLGEAYARRLAREGYDLVLVARRKERMDALAAKLKADHGAESEVLVADLASDAGIAKVEERIRRRPIEFLVNNAGFMEPKGFAAGDCGVWADLVHVRCVSAVRLTHAALGPMLARQSGTIVNMTSIGAFMPLPHNVVYTAVKRFMLTFTESLSQEVHGSGVRVQALCPGWVETDLLANPEMDASRVPKSWRSDPDWVIDRSFRALGRGKLVVIPGWRNKLLVLSVLTSYRPMLRWLVRKVRFNQVQMRKA